MALVALAGSVGAGAVGDVNMDAQNFAYWLQGFVELTQGQTPNPAQWKSICDHLAMVFSKVTPPLRVPSASPAPAGQGYPSTVDGWAEYFRKHTACGQGMKIQDTVTIC